jgi:hypothetical protein
MTRSCKLAYLAFLLVVVVVTMPFVTPDMPWWAGMAVVTPLLAMAAVYDHLWGVHAQTRRILAEGEWLRAEVARLPECFPEDYRPRVRP